MEIIKKQLADGTLELYLSGRIDTNTAPQLREAIARIPRDTAALTMDFRDVPIVTSAGLRELRPALFQGPAAVEKRQQRHLRRLQDRGL